MSVIGTGNCKSYIRKAIASDRIRVERVGEPWEVRCGYTQSGLETVQDFELSGSTYDIKDFLKSELACTWDGEDKVWRTHLSRLDSDSKRCSVYNMVLDLMGELD